MSAKWYKKQLDELLKKNGDNAPGQNKAPAHQPFAPKKIGGSQNALFNRVRRRNMNRPKTDSK